MDAWDGKSVRGINSFTKLPGKTRNYVNNISEELKLKPWILTTGPERNSTIFI
jgi:adenylosuccinate synthase